MGLGLKVRLRLPLEEGSSDMAGMRVGPLCTQLLRQVSVSVGNLFSSRYTEVTVDGGVQGAFLDSPVWAGDVAQS